MNQCLICGHIQILVVTLVLMCQAMKEENIRITFMINNKRNSYHLHKGTQGDSDGVNKEHQYISKLKLKFQRISSFSSTQVNWYLVQVDMNQSDPVAMRFYEVYLCHCYIRYHENCTQHRTMEYRFWTDIREMKQDGTLGFFLPPRPLRVNGFIQRYQ